LVIYSDKRRVDYSFWPVDLLKEFISNRQLPESYKNGYKVLIDKDRLTVALKESSGDGFLIDKPTQSAFSDLVYDFWYEACCISKNIKRKNYWYSKKLENGPIMDYLLKMLLWSERNKLKGTNVSLLGKDIEKYVDDDKKHKLKKFFTGYGRKGSISSLRNLQNFFSELTAAVSKKERFEVNADRIRSIKEYIDRILNDK